MKKYTHLPGFVHYLTFCLMFFSVFISIYVFSFILITYVIIFALYRKSREMFSEREFSAKGIIFSPVSGKVIDIKTVDDSCLFEGCKQVVTVLVPWWKEFSIYSPIGSEVIDSKLNKGLLKWRFSRSEENAESRRLIFQAKNGFTYALEFVHCITGGKSNTVLLPGDRVKRQSVIGYFPFGGLVSIYLPSSVEISVKINEQVSAAESIVATLKPDSQLERSLKNE